MSLIPTPSAILYMRTPVMRHPFIHYMRVNNEVNPIAFGHTLHAHLSYAAPLYPKADELSSPHMLTTYDTLLPDCSSSPVIYIDAFENGGVKSLNPEQASELEQK